MAIELSHYLWVSTDYLIIYQIKQLFFKITKTKKLHTLVLENQLYESRSFHFCFCFCFFSFTFLFFYNQKNVSLIKNLRHVSNVKQNVM